MKAYEITITTWPNLTIIVSAETAGKAKYREYSDAHEAAFDIKFTDFRAKRKPEFDHLAKKAGFIIGWQDENEKWGCLK